MCVSVCANGIAAGHHRRAARKPAAAPENKLTGASKVFFLEKTFGDLESFFFIPGASVPMVFIVFSRDSW